MSKEQAQKDYLEALAEYQSHINTAAFIFLRGKGFSERKIKKDPNLLEPYIDEFASFVKNSAFLQQMISASQAKMKDAESRM